MKLAAIDVGSNAARLLVVNVVDEKDGNILRQKGELYRVPLQLGDEVFITGKVGPEKSQLLSETIKAFSILMHVHGVEDYLAFATSAMRTATNQQEIIDKIKLETGLYLQIIDGKLEAETIALSADYKRYAEGNYLFIDVGGGSTELTLYIDGEERAARSFKVGTLRLKHNKVDETDWTALEDWLIQECQQCTGEIIAVGSGGNINRYYKYAKGRSRELLEVEQLRSLYEKFRAVGIDERIKEYNMKPDRADVIVPAGEIFLKVLDWASVSKIRVPQIGLGDGMIRLLYQRNKAEQAYKQMQLTELTV